MVRSLVGAGNGCAILNMQPQTKISYCGSELVVLPISDPLPPLNLAIGYNKSQPRKLVKYFVDACAEHFSKVGPEACIISI